MSQGCQAVRSRGRQRCSRQTRPEWSQRALEGSGGVVTRAQGKQSTVSAEQMGKARASRSGKARWLWVEGHSHPPAVFEKTRKTKGGSSIRVNLRLGLCF